MKKAQIIILVLSLAVAIISGIYLLFYAADSHEQKEIFEDLAAETAICEPTGSEESKPVSVPTQDEETGEPTPEPVLLHDPSALKARNRDCIGWITVSGTNIDYPVMQTKDDPEYYLRHNFDREYSDYGVPFLDAKCEPDGGNLILYGHNKFDGTMFTSLVYFPGQDLSGYEIRLEIDGELRVYRAIAAFSVNAATTKVYDYTILRDHEDKIKFLSAMQSEGSGAVITDELSDCEFITLSTCDVSRTNGRIVVIGVRSK